MNDWLTLPAAAAVAGVSAARLRRAFDAGLVPGYRRGRGRRFVRRGDAEPLSPAPPIEPVPATLEARLDALARELAHTDTLDETLFELAGGLLDLTGGVDCDVWLPEGDRLRCVISRDLQGIDATVTGKVLDLERYPYTSRVLHAGRPRVVDDVGAASALTTFERDTMLYWGFRSVLSIPMQNGREVVGLIEVTDVVPRDFAAIRKALAGAGPRFAEAFNKAVLLDRLAQGNRRLESHNRRLASLVAAARSLASSLVPEEVLAAIARTAAEALGSDECVIWEYDAAADVIVDRSFYSHGVTTYEGLGSERVAVSENPDYRALLEGRVIVEERISDPDLPASSRESMLKWDEKCCLTVPLIVGDEVVGLLVLVETHVERHFTDEERELARALADQAAAAFHNARLYREQEEQNRRLASLLDAGRAMTSSLVVEDVLNALARKAAEAVDAPECVIYEYVAADDVIVMHSDWVAPGSGLEPYPGVGESFPLSDYPDDRRILQAGRPVQQRIDDPCLDAIAWATMKRWGERTRLNVPFAFGDEPLGYFVIIESERDREFTDREVELVRGIGEQAAAAVHNAELYRQVQQRQRETELLNEIARKITSSLRVDEIADVSLSELRKLVPFDRGTVVLVDDRGLLTTVLSTGGRRVFDGVPLEAISTDVVARLRAERVVLLDLPEENPFTDETPFIEGLRSGAIVGLYAEGEMMAALSLGSERPHAFSEHDRVVLRRVGTHLSLALGNAHLYENIRRLHLNNLKALSSALSAKDYYTLGHAARVAAYMVLLGNELGWPSELIAQAEEAAYLHDIGKIAISDRVLLKPSRLNAREWELMRQHPAFSADIISALFEPAAVAAVRHHHECWDGSGYPDGLARDDIPELAQAMCIVDSYDAMSSWRPYRAAMSYADCLAELERCRGHQFSPRMVDALRRVLEAVATRHAAAAAVARAAAAAIDVAALRRVAASEGADSEAYERVAATLRTVRDAHPPTRYLTAIVPAPDGTMMIAVDPEEDPAQHSAYGETVLADDELQATLAGREIDSTVVLVEAWGSWIAGTAPLCDEDGRIVGAISADLPADVDVHLDTARGNLSETFSALVHSAALRLNRAEVDAITDGLTGVYNHRYLHERLAQEVEGADERQSTLTLLFCDIDRFKLFNDRHGHSVGDAALHGVAQIVESSIRHVDVAARYGGEEFAVILIDTGPEAGHRIAERIRRRIAQTSFGDDGRLTISIGLATYPDDADTPERLIERADAAMYEAKRLGRDRVATCAAGAVSAEASPPAGDDGCAGGAAAARRLTEARDSYERSRADLLSWVAGEVALRLGLSDEAAGEVARQTRDRVRAGRRARGRAPAVPPAARRQVTSDLAERIAAAVLLCERPIQRDGAGPAADDRERLVSTLRRDTRGRADQVVLEALADVLMAHPAPAETTDS